MNSFCRSSLLFIIIPVLNTLQGGRSKLIPRRQGGGAGGVSLHTSRRRRTISKRHTQDDVCRFDSQKVWLCKTLHRQGAPVPRNEAYFFVGRNDEGGSATQHMSFFQRHPRRRSCPALPQYTPAYPALQFRSYAPASSAGGCPVSLQEI